MQNPQKDLNSCSCAIIVTYNPVPAVLLALVGQISQQSDFLLIDNVKCNCFIATIFTTVLYNFKLI